MSDSDINQAIEDVHYLGHELHIRDKRGRLISNIFEIERNYTRFFRFRISTQPHSSTEIEKDMEHIEETSHCRSKRLTKTNLNVRLNSR